MYDIGINLYKPFAIKFLQRIGGNEFYISLFNSLPGIIGALVVIPGALFISRIVNKKKATIILFYISRMFFLLIALVPFVSRETQAILFVVLIGLMNLPDSISQTALQSFLGKVFLGNTRSTAITLRNKFGSVFVLITILITGLVIRIIPKNDSEIIIAYQIFYVVAFLVGMFEVSKFKKIEKDKRFVESAVSEKFSISLKTIFSNKKFTKFLFLTLIFQFTWQLGWPVTSVYQVIHLNSNELWIAITAVLTGISAYIFATYWNKLIKYKGNNATFVLASLFIAISILLVYFAKTVEIFAVITIFSGFAMIGTNTTLFNGLLESTPNENRVMYIAVYNTFVFASLALSPILAFILMSNFDIKNVILIIFSLRLISFFIMFFNYKNKKGAK